MNIIFFGNTQYSAIGMRILHEQLGISYAVTLPDRLDKKDRPLPSPVKTFASENNIPVIEANKLTPEIIEQIAELQPDFLVVEDYGLILPRHLLELPKYAPLNIHHSLLPKYRGPSPAPTAILNGEAVSGVSVIHMSGRVDAGDIYAQTPYTLTPDETTDSLLTVLNKLGGELVVKVIHDIKNGSANPQKQDETHATLTYYMKKTDGYFEINDVPDSGQARMTYTQKLDRMIRAYYPWPGVWTKCQMLNGKWQILKFLPGEKLQMEGKKPMSMKDFFNGYPELKPQIEKLLHAT